MRELDRELLEDIRECWPIKLVKFSYNHYSDEGYETTDLQVASRYLYDLCIASSFDMCKMEVFFEGEYSYEDFIYLVPKSINNKAKPEYFLSEYLIPKIFHRFHVNLKRNRHIGPREFLDSYTKNLIYFISKGCRNVKNFDNEFLISLRDEMIHKLGLIAQQLFGQVIFEKELGPRSIKFENGFVIKRGDKIRIRNNCNFRGREELRGKILSIHPELNCFRVRTMIGVTMYHFEDIIFRR